MTNQSNAQIPHYHLQEATAAVKPVLGPYYREPVPCPPHGVPTQLVEPLVRSFGEDHYVEDAGDVVFYKKVRLVDRLIRLIGAG